mmetsp:Transcript_19813/g.32516  ORF Transcript_19813/g.32516 Transcript_19813/m.32516 type:complete len:558 (-) Transcript_19813:1736-3409(-)
MTSMKTGKRSRSMMFTSSSALVLATVLSLTNEAAAFVKPASTAPPLSPTSSSSDGVTAQSYCQPLSAKSNGGDDNFLSNIFKTPTEKSQLEKNVATLCTTLGFSALFLTNPLLPHLPFSEHFSSARAEDELYAKYGGKGFDSSLVDANCLTNKCSLQAKACLQDDPDCRKGLTCTAKCLGDNACITGCFARYGNPNLDNLLKCTIEDNECIKVAILEGGADAYGEEPRSPAPTVQNFDLRNMEGKWYKVVGYNPNYDCYACQRNTFSAPEGGIMDGLNTRAGGILGSLNIGADRLQMDVEFSMPRYLPDGSPEPPSGVRETMVDGSGLQSVGYNQYQTHETMVFDDVKNPLHDLTLGKNGEEKLYSRTAHSEGEMFGLKFWENWYVIGENEPGQDEFKFIYYNGKTRQNTYEGGFIYSRSRSLSPASMEKVYQIAKDAGMNPDQFCKINNGCFEGEDEVMAPTEREGLGSPSNPFRGILASTKVSEFLGVESVAAEPLGPKLSTTISNDYLEGPQGGDARPWWKEAGDYLEDPRKHFQLMQSLREDMPWPEYIRQGN